VWYATKFFNDSQVAYVCACVHVCVCVYISYYVIKINLMARFLIDAYAKGSLKQTCMPTTTTFCTDCTRNFDLNKTWL